MPVVKGAFLKTYLWRQKCLDCDAIYGPEETMRLSAEGMQKLYDDIYNVYGEGETYAFEEDSFGLCDPVKGGRYLNFGAGSHRGPTDRLRGKGYDVVAYEPFAPSPVSVGRGGVFGPFDGVFSHNVIEHLADPVAEFRWIASLLKPGGKTVHSTDCFEYKVHDSEAHLVFLLGRSTKVLAERTGFEWIGLPERSVAGYKYHALVLRKR